MSVQVIRPAGAGHETLHVFLVALIIVLLAGAVVVLRSESEPSVAIAADQFDARRDLNAAEQGIHTDLLVALDEIHLYGKRHRHCPNRSSWQRRASLPSSPMPALPIVVAMPGSYCRRTPMPPTSVAAQPRQWQVPSCCASTMTTPASGSTALL